MLRRNCLIFHSGALGDFVLSWPLALALGRIYAQSRIIYVTTGQKGVLAEKAVRVDSLDVEGGWHQLFSTNCVPTDKMLRSLQGAHAIFSFVAAPDSSWVQNVKRLAPEARLFLIDPNPPAGAHLHSSQHMLNQLAHDPVVSTALTQMFKSIQDRGLGMTGAADGPVIIHPGAGATSKCWPLDRFVELARRLRDSGRRVRAIIGEVEAERWTPAQRNAFGDLAELCEPPTLMDLYTALSPASAMVGNDSGPTHLAGIMGVHTIALFGPTNSAIWRPMGPRVDVIQGDTLDAITVDQVVERWGAQAKG